MGFKLPEAPKPVAAYISARQSGKLIFTAGKLPMANGELTSKGLIGQDIEVDEANKVECICTLNALTPIRGVVGDLDRIKQIIRAVGYVASLPAFSQQPALVNIASKLLHEIFGEASKHARSAEGIIAFSFNASVEIELTLEV